MAAVLKKHQAGCWYYTLGGKMTIRCDDYADALRKAVAFGSTPARWSTDHPLNAKFAPAL